MAALAPRRYSCNRQIGNLVVQFTARLRVGAAIYQMTWSSASRLGPGMGHGISIGAR
jgi:hypothetical protein